jgi:4-hydroxybenzoate polyprenyltransferase
MKRLVLILVFILGLSGVAFAQTEPQRVAGLENRVSTLEQKIRSAGDAGVALFVCAALCALWAQNSGRNAWLWFFLGLFFSVIALLVLLYKNSNDRDGARRPRRRFDLDDFRQQ